MGAVPPAALELPAASAPTYTVRDGELRLSIPPSQGLWAPGIHETPLRVSCVQTASFSGPVGNTIGGQPFPPGQVVRGGAGDILGLHARYGHVEVRMRAVLSPRSMVAFWMSGVEDRPERSAEICVMEVFGRPRIQSARSVEPALFSPNSEGAWGDTCRPTSPARAELAPAPRRTHTGRRAGTWALTGVRARSGSSCSAVRRGRSPARCH